MGVVGVQVAGAVLRGAQVHHACTTLSSSLDSFTSYLYAPSSVPTRKVLSSSGLKEIALPLSAEVT